jgi:hypothetical protein
MRLHGVFFEDTSFSVQASALFSVKAPAFAIAIRQRARKKFRLREKYRAKNKSPAMPGFERAGFRLSYFASLPI